MMYRNKLLAPLLIVGLALIVMPAHAELRIEVTKGVDSAVRIAVVPFDWRGRGRLPVDVSEVVAADLRLSGRFEALPSEQMLSFPNRADDVLVRDWRKLRVEYLVIGYLTRKDGKIQLHYELFNVFKQEVEIADAVEGTVDQLRDLAHYASDTVFKELTGIAGAFSSRIMYITATGGFKDRMFSLNIADADGQRARVIMQSANPILSATWAPDGERVAYVSFERDDRPAIFIHDLASGKKQQITNFRGLNGAPAFSPDGRQLAMVLSRDGNPEIYVMDLGTRRLKRITRHYGVDTEPSWTPDGERLVFTSDRGGRPQIYQVRLANFEIERLTFEGDYNAKASLLPDGSAMVMVHRRKGIFHIGLMDFKRGRMTVLTETSLDESPSIAPNGSMLIYATQVDERGILAAVSIDGGVKFNLPATEGDVREPAWSPGNRRVVESIM